MNILITPKSFALAKAKTFPLLETLGFNVIENDKGRTLTEDELIAFAEHGVVGMIVGVDPVTARVIDACRDLRAISKYGVGLDNIDVDAARRRGIKIASAVATNHISVAELTIALLFEAARRLSSMIASVRNGSWQRQLGIELTGKTLLVVGGGMIGKEVAKRARGLMMKVLLYDPYAQDEAFLREYGIVACDSLHQGLEQADAVSLHVPLTPETRRMIGRDELCRMKPTAILVNTSRGELVDEEALYEALRERRIAFAAQDVFSVEPPPPGAPLLSLDEFVLTPHAGAYTREAVERTAVRSVENLIDLLRG